MKSSIRKTLDNLGRLCIPKSMRDKLEIISDETPVDIYENGNEIIIRKVEDVCTFCRKKGNLISYNGKCICTKCLNNIKSM